MPDSNNFYLTFSWKLRFGQKDLSQPLGSPKEQIRDIIKATTHPMFNQPAGARYHDIAILKVQPLILSQNIRKICLPERATNSSVRFWEIHATVAGWGAEVNGGPPVDLLMDVQLSIFTIKQVNRSKIMCLAS